MLCSLVMENGDIVHKAASFCDLSDLIRLRLLNRTWRDVVMSIFLQLYGGHDSEIRLYTFKPRLDYPNIIWHCLAAWTSYRRPIGRFLLTGGCFAGALPHECCLIETRSSNQAEIELVETVDSMQITHDGLNHEENVSNTATIQPRAEYLQLRRTPFPNEALSSRIGASSCAVAVTGNRLLFGGWDTHSANVVQKIYSLDPRNLELGWRDTGSITPTPLCFSSSTTLRDGRILFSGGGSSPYRGAAVSPGCFISDPGEESDIQWRPYLSMNTRRCGHVTMTALDGSVVALGGYSGDLSYLRTGEILAEQSHAWTSLPDMEFQRSGAGCVLGYDGCIYIVGGSPDGTLGLASMERLDLRERRWSRMPDMTIGRGYTAAVLGPNHDIYVSGGVHEDVQVNTIECFDIRKGIWRSSSWEAVDSWSNYRQQELIRAGHQMIYIWE